jgi:hypothetical protein
LARDCARRRHLLGHLFGQLGHWTSVPVTLATLLLMATLIGITSTGDQDAHEALQWFVLVMVPVTVLGSVSATVVSMLRQMRATRREQALLRLAPGIARAPGLNEALARAMLARILPTWAALMLAGTVLLGLLGLGTGAIGAAVAVCCVAWVFTAPLLRDYARLGTIAAAQAWVRLASLVVVMLTGLLPPLRTVLGPPAWLAVPVLLALAGIVLRARMRRVAQLAPAFPAGRLD